MWMSDREEGGFSEHCLNVKVMLSGLGSQRSHKNNKSEGLGMCRFRMCNLCSEKITITKKTFIMLFNNEGPKGKTWLRAGRNQCFSMIRRDDQGSTF